MNQKIVNMLIKPGTNENLEYFEKDGIEWLQDKSDNKYKIDDGIIRFLAGIELSGNNKSFQKMYDGFSGLYDFVTHFFALFRRGGEKRSLMQYLSELDIIDGEKVIEISIGTGRNIKYLNPQAEYFGVDISFGMLRKCMRNMLKRRYTINLIQAEAENLPLRDNSFDHVFSAGGFNYFNDRQKAIDEMLRIAKPGTKLMISDEPEKMMKSFENIPIFGKLFKQDMSKKPIDFVPKNCLEIQYREICNGDLYVLTFIKP